MRHLRSYCLCGHIRIEHLGAGRCHHPHCLCIRFELRKDEGDDS